MKKRMFALITAFMMLAVVLAGCGGGGTASGDGSQAGTGHQSQTSEASGDEPIELVLMSNAVEGPMAEYFNNVLPQLWLDDHPGTNITLRHEAMPDGDLMGAPLQVRYASGNSPDIQLMTVEMTLNLVEAGYLLPLDEFYTDEVRADYFDGIVEGVSTFDGHQYTFVMHRGLEMFAYDAAALREANIEPPETPEELVAAAAAVTTPERYGMAAFIDPSTHLIMTWMPMIWGQGGEVLNETLDAGALNSPEVIKGLNVIRELSASGSLNPLPSRPGSLGGILADGEAVFQLMPFGQCRQIEQNYPDRLADIEVARYPMPEGRPFVTFGGGWAAGASAVSKHPEEAKQVAHWLAIESDETVKNMCIAIGNMPCRRSVLEDPEVAALYEGKLYSTIMSDPEYLDGVRMTYIAPSDFSKILIDMFDRTLFELDTPVETIAEEQNAKMDEFIATYTGPKDGLRRQDLGLPS